MPISFRKNFLPKCNIRRLQNGKYVATKGSTKDLYGLMVFNGVNFSSLRHTMKKYDSLDECLKALYLYAVQEHLKHIESPEDGGTIMNV